LGVGITVTRKATQSCSYSKSYVTSTPYATQKVLI